MRDMLERIDAQIENAVLLCEANKGSGAIAIACIKTALRGLSDRASVLAASGTIGIEGSRWAADCQTFPPHHRGGDRRAVGGARWRDHHRRGDPTLRGGDGAAAGTSPRRSERLTDRPPAGRHDRDEHTVSTVADLSHLEVADLRGLLEAEGLSELVDAVLQEAPQAGLPGRLGLKASRVPDGSGHGDLLAEIDGPLQERS
jgi:hypothetical protein